MSKTKTKLIRIESFKSYKSNILGGGEPVTGYPSHILRIIRLIGLFNFIPDSIILLPPHSEFLNVYKTRFNELCESNQFSGEYTVISNNKNIFFELESDAMLCYLTIQ